MPSTTARRGVVAAVAAAGLGAALLAPSAVAKGQPANKAAVAASTVEYVAMSDDVPVEEVLLQGTIKTSRRDALISLNLECSIVDRLTTTVGGQPPAGDGEDPASDSAEAAASGALEVWVEVTGGGLDGAYVPVSFAPLATATKDDSTVTFCQRDRRQLLELTDAEQEPDGIDELTLETAQVTMSTHGFDWLATGLQPGETYTFVVKGALDADATGDAEAEAKVAKRLLTIETIKTLNGFEVPELD